LDEVLGKCGVGGFQGNGHSRNAWGDSGFEQENCAFHTFRREIETFPLPSLLLHHKEYVVVDQASLHSVHTPTLLRHLHHMRKSLRRRHLTPTLLELLSVHEAAFRLIAKYQEGCEHTGHLEVENPERTLDCGLNQQRD